MAILIMSDTPFKIEHLKAVILIGNRDFGRCPVASRLNRALWPILCKPALQVLLDALTDQGVRHFVISCETQSDIIKKSVSWDKSVEVTFHEEVFPRGPAGCVRDAMSQEDELLLVLPANIVNPPRVHDLVKMHHSRNAEMTVFLNPKRPGQKMPDKDSQVYLCSPQSLQCVPETGFFDLKEGLIPALVKDGKTIASAYLPEESGNYRNWIEYIVQIKQHCFQLLHCNETADGFTILSDWPNVQVGSNVYISNKARFFGPVVICSNSTISGDAIVFGPTVIGENVTVSPGSIIEESVIWSDSTIGDESRIRYSLIDYEKTIPCQSTVSDELVSLPGSYVARLSNDYRGRKIRKSIQDRISENQEKSNLFTLKTIFENRRHQFIGLFSILCVLAALIFSYWNPTLKELIHIWIESDEYSSGLLVPVIVAYVLWARRKDLSLITIHPCLWAAGLLVLSQCIRLAGLYFGMSSGQRISFVLTIGSIVFCLFGWRFFKRFFSVFLFLFLMLPFPARVQTNLTAPLQGWATASSVFCLETLGFSVIQEGNIIDIDGTRVAVAEACNGLRMLTAFIVVCGLVTLVTNRRLWEKIVILLSSIPIALLCNTLRLTVTAIAFTELDTERWETVFHDFGGFAMMPIALLLIVFELWLLSRIVIEPKIVSRQNKQNHIINRRKPKEDLG